MLSFSMTANVATTSTASIANCSLPLSFSFHSFFLHFLLRCQCHSIGYSRSDRSSQSVTASLTLFVFTAVLYILIHTHTHFLFIIISFRCFSSQQFTAVCSTTTRAQQFTISKLKLRQTHFACSLGRLLSRTSIFSPISAYLSLSLYLLFGAADFVHSSFFAYLPSTHKYLVSFTLFISALHLSFLRLS